MGILCVTSIVGKPFRRMMMFVSGKNLKMHFDVRPVNYFEPSSFKVHNPRMGQAYLRHIE